MEKINLSKEVTKQIKKTIPRRYSWLNIFVAIGISFLIIVLTSILLNFLKVALTKTVSAAELNDYQAERIEQSYPGIINLEAEKGYTFWVKFKNVGRKTWFFQGNNQFIFQTLSQQAGEFYHPWWPNKTEPIVLNGSILSGETTIIKFALRAPKTNGLYWEKFSLFDQNGQVIPGGDIEIGIRSHGGIDPILPSPSSTITPASIQENIPTSNPVSGITKDNFWEKNRQWQTDIPQSIQYDSEPEIRVGLYYVEKQEANDLLPIRISSLNLGSYQIKNKNDELLIWQTQGEEIEIKFDWDIQRYFIESQGVRLLMTDSYLKFVPQNQEQIFKIANLNNNYFWGEKVEDNEYVGELEIKYNPSTDRLWIINQLAMEKYLNGLKELQDYYPLELLKAQAIAARSYALARLNNPKYTNTPDGKAIFTVRATQGDQVYRGYQGERRSPNFVAAVQSTEGIAVTHDNLPILAYYFAQTDGWLRDCQAAGMCRQPVSWLIEQPDPACEGLSYRGHGVGMSQIGAKYAANQGADFKQILNYYYNYPNSIIKELY